jgi:hypothetical protein
MIERSKMKETFPDWYNLIWLNSQRWRKCFLIDITSYDWTVKDEQSYEVISIRKHFLHLWPFNHMRLYQSGNISFFFDRSIIWGHINQETLPSSLTVQSYEVKMFPDWYNLIWLNGQRWRKRFLIDITSYDWTVKDEGNVSWLI